MVKENMQKHKQRLVSPRSRVRKVSEMELRIEKILQRHHVERYLPVQSITKQE